MDYGYQSVHLPFVLFFCSMLAIVRLSNYNRYTAKQLIFENPLRNVLLVTLRYIV